MVDALKIIGGSASETLMAKVAHGIGTKSLKLENGNVAPLIVEQIKKKGSS